MNAFIRLLYSILIALTVVAFIGVGIFSLYQPPKEPSYPDSSSELSDAEYTAAQDKYDKSYKNFESDKKKYQHNVTVTLLVATAVIVIAGLYLFKRSAVIGEGLALGGVATTVYGIITASLADARILRFVMVTELLLAVLLITYFRFSHEKK